MIAITFALPAESQEFLRSLSNKSRGDRNGTLTIRGKVDDRAIEVFHTGVGEKVCRQRLEKFLSATERIRRGEQNQQFDCLISTGFAGALTSGAAAVDMETEFIARACAAHSVPLLSLRVISDTPRELFPAPANVLFDIERQQTQILKLATHLLTHPTHVPRLVQFARRITRARKILADALVALLHGL